MTKSLQKALDRLQKWPKERQEDAAKVLLAMEAQDANSYQLNEEQVAEVRRRLNKRGQKHISVASAFKRFRSR